LRCGNTWWYGGIRGEATTATVENVENAENAQKVESDSTPPPAEKYTYQAEVTYLSF
jgi:hypothetical protein